MLENTVTMKAESVEKAIKLGLTKLGITQEDAVINIISEGKRGLFGFGKQDAIVEVSTNQKISITNIDNTPTNTVEHVDVPMQQIDTVESVTDSNIVAIDEKPVVEIENIETLNVNDIEETSEVLDVTTPQEINTSEKSSINYESLNEVAKYLEEVALIYGAPSKVDVIVKGKDIEFNLDTEKAGLIIGKHGKIIDALQSLAQVLVHRDNTRRTNVIVNVGDYRHRRAKVLAQIANRTSKQVLKTKQAVILEPLPAYERKQIHGYLSKIDHITTHSEGKEPNRYLVVEYVN